MISDGLSDLRMATLLEDGEIGWKENNQGLEEVGRDV